MLEIITVIVIEWLDTKAGPDDTVYIILQDL